MTAMAQSPAPLHAPLRAPATRASERSPPHAVAEFLAFHHPLPSSLAGADPERHLADQENRAVAMRMTLALHTIVRSNQTFERTRLLRSPEQSNAYRVVLPRQHELPDQRRRDRRHAAASKGGVEMFGQPIFSVRSDRLRLTVQSASKWSRACSKVRRPMTADFWIRYLSSMKTARGGP